jgi:hypothetical protein
VNKLAPVQAFNMISQAVSNGVSIERIASTLNVKVEWVNRMGVLLVGIAPEIIERLKKRVVAQALLMRTENILHLPVNKLTKETHNIQILHGNIF